jgi:hypothetical protein
MEKVLGKSRCVSCRAEIEVTDRYAHGDHITCGTCDTRHRVLRGDVLRLVLSDVAPLKEQFQDNQKRIEDLEVDLRHASASLGVGANGVGVGVIWIIYQVAHKDAMLSSGLFWQAAGLALVSGLLLELSNYLFLAKRHKMTQLSADIATLKGEGRQLQQKIRDASRA